MFRDPPVSRQQIKDYKGTCAPPVPMRDVRCHTKVFSWAIGLARPAGDVQVPVADGLHGFYGPCAVEGEETVGNHKLLHAIHEGAQRPTR